jgi:hypothetical protein
MPPYVRHKNLQLARRGHWTLGFAEGVFDTLCAAMDAPATREREPKPGISQADGRTAPITSICDDFLYLSPLFRGERSKPEPTGRREAPPDDKLREGFG